MKEVKNYENLYVIDEEGNVKSLGRWVNHSTGKSKVYKKPKTLKQSTNNHGYKTVALFDNSGNKKTWPVHMLVAINFLNHIPDGTHKLVVDHIDNNRLNNNYKNLQIITARENTSKDRKGGSSKYVGVSWYKKTSKWIASINIDGKKKSIGYFENEYDAHLAYQNILLTQNNIK